MLSGCATVVSISDSVVVIDSQAFSTWIWEAQLTSSWLTSHHHPWRSFLFAKKSFVRVHAYHVILEDPLPLCVRQHSSGSTPSAPHKSQAM
ncbi:hypothetical protein PGTUg99_023796 [Puccinia graminis f. sp. tritici]|nr:hypothetical protein PGTUg99_023796 [Puccinia graminis f. sp. tritici]